MLSAIDYSFTSFAIIPPFLSFNPDSECPRSYMVVSQMVSTMKEMNLAIESSTWALIIATCSRRGRHKLAEDYFDIMLECGVEPTPFTWTALVQAKARGKHPFPAFSQYMLFLFYYFCFISHFPIFSLQLVISLPDLFSSKVVAQMLH